VNVVGLPLDSSAAEQPPQCGDFAGENRTATNGILSANRAVPGSATALNSADGRRAITSTIEGDIVPRLLLMCRTHIAGQDQPPMPASPHPWDIDELARLLIAHGPETAWSFVEAVRHRGVPAHRICLELLAPTAHRLAEQWEQREFGEPELALGLDRLLTVLLGMERVASSSRQKPSHG